MERQYIQVKPSSEDLNPDDIVSHISSLHKLTQHDKKQSIRAKLNPLEDSSKHVPEFEFLALSQGEDTPVEFLYGTEKRHLEALKNRLTTAYPSSFDVEMVGVDVLKKIIPPERYAPDDFVKKIENGHLLFDENAAGTVDDLEGGKKTKTETNAENVDPGGKSGSSTSTSSNNYTGDEKLNLDVARPSETTTPSEDEKAVTGSGETKQLSPEDIDGYDMLAELDAGLLDLVDLPSEVNTTQLETQIEGPTWTEDGEILARPTLEHGEPIAARWDGEGERKKDWMTTMKMFSKITRPSDNEAQDRAPLATLIQHLSGSDLPIAFQVVFKRVEDWSRQAERRKDNLHLNRDTMTQKIMYEVGELIHKPSQERRRERLRDHMEDIGESADMNAESPISGDVGRRRKLIDNKIPKRTFRANVRAVSVANDEVPVADVEETMENLASVLDHLDGYFYGLKPTILRDGEGLRNKTKATEEFHRLVNREIVSGSGKSREDIIVNADELANFITVPSSGNLTVEGVRGTRAEAESRDPLPKPNADLMREFHEPGMRIGYALDKEAETEPVPTQVPPKLLTTHYGRFATTGAGKSKALINDILSLHENTSGPTILIDPKGDGMAENYMRTHFERFGEEDFKENLIHFPVPDILPGFAFFNIESAVDERVKKNNKRDRKDLRGDVIQNKADHYQEILKLVMGLESYGDSKVAPILISSFVKLLYDEAFVADLQRERERGEGGNVLNDRDNVDYFTHRQLEKLARLVKQGVVPSPVEPVNEPIRETIEEQVQGDEHTFQVILNSVFNRLNYIREDQHLRKLFNNTQPNFDFREVLSDDKVILFDLGELRDDATMVLTGVIMTELWDAIRSTSRTSCTQNHSSIEECREKARKNGLDEAEPPCREQWGDEHVVNLIIDEAASVAVSNVMTKMLEQGRSFHLSVGLSMQFPEQMKDASDRVYKNVLNNIATKLIGKITLDEEIAKAMAHEGMDVDDFNNRISALPRGEWIAQLPSPTFMETGPEPFSLQPLPIPAGHPESKYVLNEESEQRFNHYLNSVVHKRTKEKYGIAQYMSDTTRDANLGKNVDTTNIEGANTTSGSQTSQGNQNTTQKTGDGSNESTGDNGELNETVMGDMAIPDEMFDDNGEISDVSSNESSETNTGTHNVDDDGSEGTGEGESTIFDAGVNSLDDEELDEESLPNHIKWSDIGYYECQVCGKEHYANDRRFAVRCCEETVAELRESLGDPSKLTSRANDSGFTQSRESYLDHEQEIRSFYTVVKNTDLGFKDGDKPSVSNIEIKRKSDLKSVMREYNTVTVGGVLSAVVSEFPPEYQSELDALLSLFVQDLQHVGEELQDGVEPTEDCIRELIYTTPPADVNVNVEALLERITGTSPETDVLDRWRNVGSVNTFKRFYSGKKQFNGVFLKKTGAYGKAYNPRIGLDEPVVGKYQSPKAFGLPDEDNTRSSSSSSSGGSGGVNIPVKKVGTAAITDEHLDEHGVTRSEAAFMKAVVKAMNNDLEGYSLLESMASTIKPQYDIDEDKLKEKGYIKRHTGANNQVYYSVTSDGQHACRMTKEHGFTIGDLGDDTPHRVGVELVKQYYESLENVQRVELSPKENGAELDVVVIDTHGKQIAVIEVEAGRTTADTQGEKEGSALNDYAEVRRDYTSLGVSDGDSIWVVRNNEVAGSVLRALKAGDAQEVPFNIPIETIERIENRTLRLGDFNEELVEIDDPGISKLMTYKQLRNKLSSNTGDT